jgi:hypothetical protein
MLIVVAAVALGTMFHFVRLEEQLIWILLSTLGIGGVAKFRQWRESKTDDDAGR